MEKAKNGFENIWKTKSVCYFSTTILRRKDQDPKFFDRKVLLKQRSVAWALDWRNQARSFGRIWVWKPIFNYWHQFWHFRPFTDRERKSYALRVKPRGRDESFPENKKTAPSPFNSNLGGSRVWQNTKLLKNSKRSSIHFWRGILSKKYTATKTKPLIYWSNFVTAKSNRLHSRSLLLVFRAKDWQKFHMAY